MCVTLQVQEVCFSKQLKYLLIRLADGTSQAQLEALQPDFSELVRCSVEDEIMGVIVSLSPGAKQSFYECVL